MNNGTRMGGVRLGLTYGAAVVLLGVLIAVVSAPASMQVRIASPKTSHEEGAARISLDTSNPVTISRTPG